MLCGIKILGERRWKSQVFEEVVQANKKEEIKAIRDGKSKLF